MRELKVQPMSGDQTGGSYTRLVSTTVVSHNGCLGLPSLSTVCPSPCLYEPQHSNVHPLPPPSTPMLASCLNHPPSMYLRALPFQISTIRPPPQQLASSLNHPPTMTIVYLLVSPRFHITSTTHPPQPCLGTHSLS